jgi:hypothetical protein
MPSTASTTSTGEVLLALPVVLRDPRFVAGRATVGQPTSIDVFSTLLQEAVATYGEAHIEAAPAYYEYGNALFRYAQRQQQQDHSEDTNGNQQQHTEISKEAQVKSTREAAAAAAERRSKAINNDDDDNKDTKPVATVKNGDPSKENQLKEGESADDNNNDDDDDVQLALEMMETAWSILDNEQSLLSSSNREDPGTHPDTYRAWIHEQVPRVLTGIGDVLSALHRHADSADAYLRALGHRQEALDAAAENKRQGDTCGSLLLLLLLQYRRKVVEANILIVEELLACGNDADVVTTESAVVLVKAGSVVDYARGYYDKARDELQEAVLLLGQLAAATNNTSNREMQDAMGEEKENICFVATMVMGAGTALAEIDEQLQLQQQQQEPVKKKSKS